MERSSRIKQILELLNKEPQDLFLNYALGLEYAGEKTTATEAEQQFKKVLDLDPNYIPAWYQLGKLFETLSRNSEAISYFKNGLQKAKEKKDSKTINEFEEAIFLLED